MNRHRNQTYPQFKTLPPTSMSVAAPTNTYVSSNLANPYQPPTEVSQPFPKARPNSLLSNFNVPSASHIVDRSLFPTPSTQFNQNSSSTLGQASPYSGNKVQDIPGKSLQGCSVCNFLLQEFLLMSKNNDRLMSKVDEMNSNLNHLVKEISHLKDQVRSNTSVTNTQTSTQSRSSNNSSGKKKKKLSNKINDYEKRMKEVQGKLSEKLIGDDIYKFFRHFYDLQNLESLVSDLNGLHSDYQRVNRCFTELGKLGKESFNPQLIYKYFHDNCFRECACVIEHLCHEDSSSSSQDQQKKGSRPDSWRKSNSHQKLSSFERQGSSPDSVREFPRADQQSDRSPSDSVFEDNATTTLKMH